MQDPNQCLEAPKSGLKNSNTIPYPNRRGILSFLTIIPEYDNARNYSKGTKLLIVSIVAFAGTSGPMGTSIMMPAASVISNSLNTKESIVNISVGIYSLALGIFPMWWSSFADKHGRRNVYLISFSWFLAFSLGSCFVKSISALIVLRFLSGAGASAVQACGAATVADLYILEERGTALGLFYLGPLLGPFLSPIIGGIVSEVWNWRATMWVMVIICSINVLSILFLLPETSQTLVKCDTPKSLEKQSKVEQINCVQCDNGIVSQLQSLNSSSKEKKILSNEETFYQQSVCINSKNEDMNSPLNKPEKSKWKESTYDYIIRPAHAIVLLRYPPLALIILYSGVAFMGVYFSNISLTYDFSNQPYSFNTLIVGLTYAPNSLAYIFTSIFGGKWNDRLIRKHAKQNNGILQPESRISWNVVVSAILYPPACLIYGWCMQFGTHWVFPLIGSALFGVATMLVIGVTMTYLVDILPGRGGTAIALNNLFRQLLAAIATFITEPLIKAFGTGVLFSIYAGLITITVLSTWYLKQNISKFKSGRDIDYYYSLL